MGIDTILIADGWFVLSSAFPYDDKGFIVDGGDRRMFLVGGVIGVDEKFTAYLGCVVVKYLGVYAVVVGVVLSLALPCDDKALVAEVCGLGISLVAEVIGVNGKFIEKWVTLAVKEAGTYFVEEVVF